MRFSSAALSLVAAWSARRTRLMSSTVTMAGADSMDSLLRLMSIPDVDAAEKHIHYLDTGPSDNDAPPVVMLIGTGQSISSYGVHIRPFMRAGRRLVVAEMRSQGLRTSLDPSHCSMQQLTSDLEAFLSGLGYSNKQVDLAGFSFGGRVALSFAALRPQRVRRLSITGVPYERSKTGQLILDSWKSSLESDSGLRACAQSFLINGYSEEFLDRNYEKMPSYIDMILEQNDAARLRSLIALSHVADPADPLSAPSCASALSATGVPVQVVGSSLDRIAAPWQVLRLASAIAGAEVATIEGAGHLSLFEKPVEWRRVVLAFLNR